MAASRAIRADRKEADTAGLPVLERLQYPTAQSGKTPDESSPRGTHHGSGSANSWVTVFPSHVDGFPSAEDSPKTENRPEREPEGQLRAAELEQLLQAERAATAQAVAAAREQGHREARQAVEQQVNVEQQRLRTQILQSLEQFRLERQSYFHNVEGEVVRLALAIAARVLHREAHLDPLLLTGAVRVALEKLGDSSQVVMRVPPREVEPWKEFFRAATNLRIQPGILEDPSLSPGECLLATELGTIELGVRAQLEEIEKGFFDLLDRRPVEATTITAPTGRNAG
ncbi:MAG TPA: FliH/SctL family protein [Acidobacteriaceae bacterium]|nr:FliH/SctL family protein [Acidobacteriaceae bacterium]